MLDQADYSDASTRACITHTAWNRADTGEVRVVLLLAGDHVVVDQERAGRGASVLDQFEGVGELVLEETPTTPDHARRDD